MAAGEIRAGKAFVEAYTKDNTKPGLDGIEKKFGAFSGRMAAAGGVAVTTAATAVAAAVMKAVSTGANINDLAERYALGTTAIQQLSYAAKQSGTELELLVKGIKLMQVGIGNGKLADDLSKIGIHLGYLKGLAPEKQFEVIADAIGSLATQEEKIASATAIFGKSGAELLPLLNGGAKGIRALTGEFDRLGATMSEQAVKEAALLDDELVKLGVQFDALVVSIGSKLIPLVTELVRLGNTAISSKSGGNSAATAMNVGAMAIPGGGLIANTIRLANAQQAQLEARLDQAQKRFDAAGAERGPAGSLNEALGRYFAKLAGGMRLPNGGNINDVGRAQVKGGLDAIYEALGVGGRNRRDRALDILAGLPGNAMLNAWKFLSGTPMGRNDVASYGTFDHRDIAGGGYMQATQQQLEELRKHTVELRKLNNKKDGIRWD